MASNTADSSTVNETFNEQEFIDIRSETNNSGNESFGLTEEESSVKPKPRNKLKIASLILLGLALVLGLVYIGGVFYFQNHFLPNTRISGFNSSFQTPASVEEKLNQISHVRKVSLVGKDMVVSDIKAEDIGLNLTDSVNCNEIKSTQNPYEWPLYLFNIKKADLSNEHSIDENMLNNKLNELSIVNGDQVVQTENAKAEFNGDTFDVKKEIYGTNLNLDNLKGIVKDALENGKSEIILDQTDCYVQPTLKSDDQNLNASVAKLNTLVNSKVTYDFKTAQEVVDKNVFNQWLKTDDQGNIYFDDNQVNAYIQGLKDKYDTIGKDVVFKTSGGQDITLTEEFTGWEIDAAQEANALKDNILSGQEVTKEPIYSSTGRDRSFGNRVAGTYLEISIGAQTMWFYKDNQLIVETPVVTGDTSQGYGTPTGLYVIQSKSTDVVLRGDNADGSEYASPVTYWMPFNGGIGVHDATWRSSFGGRIYRGNGSHGCVNTPYRAAGTIYENINVNDTVVVY